MRFHSNCRRVRDSKNIKSHLTINYLFIHVKTDLVLGVGYCMLIFGQSYRKWRCLGRNVTLVWSWVLTIFRSKRRTSNITNMCTVATCHERDEDWYAMIFRWCDSLSCYMFDVGRGINILVMITILEIQNAFAWWTLHSMSRTQEHVISIGNRLW